ncbi:MAG: DUF1127 domain-containing protein [Pseudomonadota bacterium]
MTQTRNATALAYLQTRPLTPFASTLLQFVVLCVAWSERRRTRIALSKLDDHQLQDVGLTRTAADREARLPFWME